MVLAKKAGMPGSWDGARSGGTKFFTGQGAYSLNGERPNDWPSFARLNKKLSYARRRKPVCRI